MSDLTRGWHERATVRRTEHHPLCDTRLGPDFEVEPGMVTMTIFACVGFACWDEHEEQP